MSEILKAGDLAYFDTYFQGMVPIRLLRRMPSMEWQARVTRLHKGFARGEIVECLPADVKARE